MKTWLGIWIVFVDGWGTKWSRGYRIWSSSWRMGPERCGWGTTWCHVRCSWFSVLPFFISFTFTYASLFFLLTQFCFVYMLHLLRPLWLTDILLWQHIIFGSQYNPCLDLFSFVLQGSTEWCSCLGSSLYSTTSIVCDFVKVRYLSTYLTVSSFQFSPFNILSRFLFYSGEVCRRKTKVILIFRLSLLHVVDKLWNEENITNLSMDTTISWFVELEPVVLVISKF